MILAAVEAKSDITLVELRALLPERGVAVAVSCPAITCCSDARSRCLIQPAVAE